MLEINAFGKCLMEKSLIYRVALDVVQNLVYLIGNIIVELVDKYSVIVAAVTNYFSHNLVLKRKFVFVILVLKRIVKSQQLRPLKKMMKMKSVV
jgi:hypothetical protein